MAAIGLLKFNIIFNQPITTHNHLEPVCFLSILGQCFPVLIIRTFTGLESWKRSGLEILSPPSGADKTQTAGWRPARGQRGVSAGSARRRGLCAGGSVLGRTRLQMSEGATPCDLSHGNRHARTHARSHAHTHACAHARAYARTHDLLDDPVALNGEQLSRFFVLIREFVQQVFPESLVCPRPAVSFQGMSPTRSHTKRRY